AIGWLAAEGISTGWSTPSGQEFRPLAQIKRDAMAAFLYRYAGSPEVTLPAESPFVDVTPTSTEFYEEIVWMFQEGISTGWETSEGREFRPLAPVKRDAMAAFLYRYAGEPSWTDPGESPFVDVTSTSTEFFTEITWLESTGITTGWSTPAGQEYRPLAYTKRDAMATFLYRFNQLDS
ncbi:MAG: S-layer homology domain-containing protein, partial [Actinomycetes bacterium]